MLLTLSQDLILSAVLVAPLVAFVSTFSTLLAIINPLEVMPIYLKLLDGQDRQTHLWVARRVCAYATALLFFFLVFGTLLLKLFDVSLDMVRIVGGIILMRIGFSLFQPEAVPGLADAPRAQRGHRVRAAGDATDVRSGCHCDRIRDGVARVLSA